MKLLRTILCASFVAVPLVSGAPSGIEVWAISALSRRASTLRPSPFPAIRAGTQLMLELQVWDFELPEKSHLKPNIHTDTEINTFPEEMEVKYYQLLRKGLRRGSQDYKYFWLLSQGKGAKEMVDGALEAVLHGSIDEKASLGQPGTWLHDPDEWDRVRLKFGEAIEKIRKDAASAARVR